MQRLLASLRALARASAAPPGDAWRPRRLLLGLAGFDLVVLALSATLGDGWDVAHTLLALGLGAGSLVAWRIGAHAARAAQSRRRLEETLVQVKATEQQVLQQERLRAMRQVASGIAHDFNNSLSPIVGLAELLMRRPDLPEETTRTYVKLIDTAAQDLAGVVRRLRDLYRERGDSPEAAVDLAGCIAEAVALVEPRWQREALAPGVAIHVRTDVGDLPPIVGDAASLREMLASLLVNAVEAMPAGGTVTVQARAEADGVRLAVHDTGVGMSERVRERCLEPFFSTKEQHGAGLGLALVHATVERHGGTLTVESVAGQGSTFAVRLPLPRTRAAGSEPEPPAPARPLRILVVDDDPLARTAVTEQLGSEGHAVEAAAGGAEALERFTAGRFDMVITDRAMPGMGGDQLAVTLRRLSPRTPIVMLTAFGELMDARGELPAGVDAVVSKPVTLSALARAIHRVTGG